MPLHRQEDRGPARLWPDVSVIHVHEADIYGNARMRGISIADLELARASKRLIITTERWSSNLEIRNDPDRTAIPYYLVDAVVKFPMAAIRATCPMSISRTRSILKNGWRSRKTQRPLPSSWTATSTALKILMSTCSYAAA
jgi:hypothetical protein